MLDFKDLLHRNGKSKLGTKLLTPQSTVAQERCIFARVSMYSVSFFLPIDSTISALNHTLLHTVPLVHVRILVP